MGGDVVVVGAEIEVGVESVAGGGLKPQIVQAVAPAISAAPQLGHDWGRWLAPVGLAATGGSSVRAGLVIEFASLPDGLVAGGGSEMVRSSMGIVSLVR